MEYKSVFLPGSFNFSNQTLDWGQNDLLAYTSLNLIIIFDVNLQNVVQVLKCNELVAMVKWGPIKRDMDSSTKHKQISSNAMICLSVDIDNNIILWDALFGIKIIEINNQTLTKIKNYKILGIQIGAIILNLLQLLGTDYLLIYRILFLHENSYYEST
ncbi:unnamed protein product [Gordionus sp. m RMFG-2023]